MSHCYSVGVDIDGKRRDICTLVPGNEDLSKNVREAEKKQTKPRAPTKDEINRSIDYYFKQHNDKQHPNSDPNKKELDDMLEY